MSDRHLLQRRFPLFLVKLLGGDYRLLLRSGKVVARKYFQASVCLLAILGITTFSVFYGTELLFHIWQVELFLAFFISALFGCIYLFLIATFSKLTRQGPIFNLSNVVRMGFVLFMAFLISKPVEVLIFSRMLDRRVELYKRSLLNQYEQRIDRLRSGERSGTIAAIGLLKQQIALYPSRISQQELLSLQRGLLRADEEREINIKLAARRIGRSDFLLYQIRQVSREPLSWLICLLTIAIFLLPGYLIYSIPQRDLYYQLKEEAEKVKVLEEYQAFRERFKMLFREKWGLSVEPHSCFEDPPFNTKRIQKSPALSNDEFIARYLA